MDIKLIFPDLNQREPRRIKYLIYCLLINIFQTITSRIKGRNVCYLFVTAASHSKLKYL